MNLPAPLESPTPPRAANPTLAPVPVPDPQRSPSVDTLRGLAVLGILGMNIVVFALPAATYNNTHNAAVNHYAGEFTGLNAAAWWINHLLFDQKMLSIFSMLFGAGLVLQDQRLAAGAGTRHASFAATWYRRMGALFLIGMFHAYLLWFGDILVAYALCGLLLYPLRKLGPRWLIPIGLIIFSVSIAINIGLGSLISMLQRSGEEAQTLLDSGQTLTSAQQRALDSWDHTRTKMLPTDTVLLAEVTARRGGWLDNFTFNARLSFFFQTILFLIWTFWRALGLMLAGMGLAKLGFFAAAWSARAYALTALIGYTLGLSLIIPGALQVQSREHDMGFTFGLGAQYNYLGSVLVAAAHVCVVMLICKAGALKPITGRLAAVGRMAFTNYLMQSVICTLIFFGFGLGYFAHFTRAQIYLFVLGVWALELLWSPLWLRTFRFGPAEWLWRSLTYLRFQPLRRDQTPHAQPSQA